MRYRKWVYGGCGVLFVALVLCAFVAYHIWTMRDVKIIFLDVGQGDATVIMRGSFQIVIDGGADQSVLLEELGHVVPFWDRTIEIVIATHPDSDHVDGLIGVLMNYHVGQFWYVDTQKGSSVWDQLLVIVRERQVTEVHPIYGEKIFLTDYASIDIVHPYTRGQSATQNKEINDASIAMIATVGQNRFYFGGDLSSHVEDRFVFSQPITVLKASHHGSRESTSAMFLRMTNPQDIVFSVGKDNRYGHPHKDVLDRIDVEGARVFRTDENGRIMYTCTREQCVVSHE